MIKKIDIKNFTGFKDISVQFSNQLNIIIGENSSGKSHLLKLPYSVINVSVTERKKSSNSIPTKNIFQSRLAEKLISVFRPESLGRLVKRKQGRERAEIAIIFENAQYNINFSFASNSKSEVEISNLPGKWMEQTPAYLPTRELMSIYPNFISLYEQYHIEFEETWRDTCILLGAPSSRGPRESIIKNLLSPLEEAMGGKIILDANGRFYLSQPGKGNLEIPLVAEGLRKIAMLARLIATGEILNQGYLFWDEPESNLNPKLIKTIAKTIIKLTEHEIQVFLATHSLFLLREIEMLLQHSEHSNVNTRYIGLNLSEDDFRIEQGDKVEDLSVIAVLDEELKQSDRYMEFT